MTRRATSALVALSFLAAPAAASSCDEKGSQSEINQCLWEEYQSADRELNEIWKRVKAEIDKRDRELEPRARGWPKALLDAQRGWLEYRQNHCAAVGFEMRGGTGERMLVNGCLARMTRERVSELKEMLR